MYPVCNPDASLLRTFAFVGSIPTADPGVIVMTEKTKAGMWCGGCDLELLETADGYRCPNPKCTKPGGAKLSGNASIKIDDDGNMSIVTGGDDDD